MQAQSILNRRALLLGAAASCVLACPDKKPAAPAAADRVGPAAAPPPSPAPATPSSTSPLQVVTLGPLTPEEKGGQLIVVLHGWGARGDDLVPLARTLARPGTRLLVPAAPLPETGGGRAWWHLDQKDRPGRSWKDELPDNHQLSPQVTRAREAVQALLRDAKERYAPESIALMGFSQGAILSLDVAIAAAPAVDRVAVLSGVVLTDSLPALHAQPPSAPRPAVFVSHGTSDPVLPFEGGKSIASILEPRGYKVTWLPFDGGHEIPREVIAKLREFLSGT